MFKKVDFFVLSFLLFSFFVILFFRKPDIFHYRFNERLISDYLRSQDIEDKERKIKDRIFLSDADIYLASGVLYAMGEDPTKFNFQHPPLVKYLFGFSNLYFGNPYYVQVFFSSLIIILTYILGLKIFKSRKVAFLSSLMLTFDPILLSTTSQTLLDNTNTAFSLLFVLLFLLFPNNFILNGIVLGLLFASKFWSTSLILVIFVFAYHYFVLKKKIKPRSIFLTFLIAVFVFCLFYLKTFVNHGGKFNILFFEIKNLKFMLSHNSSPVLGNSLILFLTGHFVDWWGSGKWLSADVWSFLWPVSFLFVLLNLKKGLKEKEKGLFFLYPFVFFLTSLFNTAFTRYFLLILPFFYLSFSYLLIKK
ncbi:MAG: hypothetical protein KatS3mg088_449 [Patescibacteria group bacterium]|nr:MAG: hypothetical protein KatS3mg088_449 [Patescibacteria group bacterium]